MTTIVAGTTTITGDLKDYEFSDSGARFRFYVQRARDTGALVDIELPKPNEAMVEAIKNSGLKGLSSAIVDFNHNRIKITNLTGHGLAGTTFKRDSNANTATGKFVS